MTSSPPKGLASKCCHTGDWASTYDCRGTQTFSSCHVHITSPSSCGLGIMLLMSLQPVGLRTQTSLVSEVRCLGVFVCPVHILKLGCLMQGSNPSVLRGMLQVLSSLPGVGHHARTRFMATLHPSSSCCFDVVFLLLAQRVLITQPDFRLFKGKWFHV